MIESSIDKTSVIQIHVGALGDFRNKLEASQNSG
jgi:hypothetical protein